VSLCQVCDRRMGFPVRAIYRLKGEDPFSEEWRQPRLLVICRFCNHKAWAYGYFWNNDSGQVEFVEEILDDREWIER